MFGFGILREQNVTLFTYLGLAQATLVITEDETTALTSRAWAHNVHGLGFLLLDCDIPAHHLSFNLHFSPMGFPQLHIYAKQLPFELGLLINQSLNILQDGNETR
jgi:hypothetical protein